MLKAPYQANEGLAEVELSSVNPAYYEVTEDSGGFGVALRDGDKGEVILAFGEITHSRSDIEHFVSLCNRLGLSRTHLLDAIDDFIG